MDASRKTLILTRSPWVLHASAAVHHQHRVDWNWNATPVSVMGWIGVAGSLLVTVICSGVRTEGRGLEDLREDQGGPPGPMITVANSFRSDH